MKLHAGVTTDTSRVRSLNEEAYVCRGGEGLFMVCDGMGGASAVRSSHQAIYDQAQQDSQYSGMGTTVVGAWVEDHVASPGPRR